MTPTFSRTGFICWLFLLQGLFSFLWAQEKTVLIDQLISRYHEIGKFNGSILVAEEGKVIYQKGFGWANREWEVSNTIDTKFLSNT